MNARGSFTAQNQELVFGVHPEFSEEGVVDVSGTFTGTLALEGSVDASNFRTVALTPVGGGAAVTAMSAPGAWRADLSGFRTARVRATAAMTGTAVAVVQVQRRAA